MDGDTLVLSCSELAMVVEALLEPQENPEIRQARLLLALKLHLHTTGNSAMDQSAANIYIRFLDDLSAAQNQVRLVLFPNLLAFKVFSFSPHRPGDPTTKSWHSSAIP
jgi:hypothetical protein